MIAFLLRLNLNCQCFLMISQNRSLCLVSRPCQIIYLVRAHTCHCRNPLMVLFQSDVAYITQCWHCSPSTIQPLEAGSNFNLRLMSYVASINPIVTPHRRRLDCHGTVLLGSLWWDPYLHPPGLRWQDMGMTWSLTFQLLGFATYASNEPRQGEGNTYDCDLVLPVCVS